MPYYVIRETRPEANHWIPKGRFRVAGFDKKKEAEAYARQLSKFSADQYDYRVEKHTPKSPHLPLAYEPPPAPKQTVNFKPEEYHLED
ncbi:MAG: hypothetical protein JRI50_10800 [Deltaproteobacteria bacterium]|nr:hypothetical protein [Deltaproteobacteria bacterium]MBW2135859.1 hypothetical protein [Deltaproteobacteria bacterium]